MFAFGHHERQTNELDGLLFSSEASTFVQQDSSTSTLFEATNTDTDTPCFCLCGRAKCARLTQLSIKKLNARGVEASQVDVHQFTEAFNSRTAGLTQSALQNLACSVECITDRTNPAFRSDGSGRGVFNSGSDPLEPGFVLGIFTGTWFMQCP